MALPSLNRSSGGYVGLDVDGGFLAAAQVKGGRVARAVSRKLEPGLVADGEVVDVEGLSASLREFFKDEALPKRVRLGVVNQQIVVRYLELPPIADKKQLEAAVHFQTAETVAMPLEDAVIDFHEVGETGVEDGTRRIRVLVVAARRAMVVKLVEAVRGAGLKPEGVDLSAFALIRTLADQSAAVDGADARVYCHLGGVANVAVGVGSNCLFTRPLTAQLEGGEDDVDDLAEELRLSIDYYRAQAHAPPATDVFLSGPGATAEDIATRVGDLVGLPVAVANPLGGRPQEFDEQESAFRHTVSVGLALGAAS
jgi:type IV pilus assembly protein PilM